MMPKALTRLRVASLAVMACSFSAEIGMVEDALSDKSQPPNRFRAEKVPSAIHPLKGRRPIGKVTLEHRQHGTSL
jgi:hypothetical protein